MAKHGYGCKEPKIDIRDYQVKCGAVELPKKYIWNKTLPKIKNQGMVNSCVAHASSSILENYTNNTIDLSTNFIYGMEEVMTGESSPGMYLSSACKIAKKYGDMRQADCDGNDEVPTATSIARKVFNNSEKMKRAKKFKIDSYYNCSTYDDVKYAIYTYGPVLGCIYWYGDYGFTDDKPTISFNTNIEGGYHAIMIYGWDETGWYIQNSWGEDFGKNGRCVIPYEYPLAEVKVMVDKTPNLDKHLKKTNKLKKKKAIYKPVNKLLKKLKKKKVIKK